MKKQLLLSALILTLGLTSCSNDDDNNNINGIQAQAHDDNAMMDRMHTMMTQMESMTMTNDPDLDFANMMIMHHQGAIDMSNLELQNGSNQEMKTMAQDIIDMQQQEITEMQAIISGMTADETDMAFMMELMSSMDKMGTTADTQLLTGNTDRDFATLMMVHHQAAIDNASAYLHHGTNSDLRAMATMMVDMQTQEIIDLGNWLLNN